MTRGATASKHHGPLPDLWLGGGHVLSRPASEGSQQPRLAGNRGQAAAAAGATIRPSGASRGPSRSSPAAWFAGFDRVGRAGRGACGEAGWLHHHVLGAPVHGPCRSHRFGAVVYTAPSEVRLTPWSVGVVGVGPRRCLRWEPGLTVWLSWSPPSPPSPPTLPRADDPSRRHDGHCRSQCPSWRPCGRARHLARPEGSFCDGNGRSRCRRRHPRCAPLGRDGRVGVRRRGGIMGA